MNLIEANAKKFVFKAQGMHCPSCSILIENKLSKIGGVKSVKADFRNGRVEVESNLSDNPDILADRFTKEIKPFGYYLVAGKQSANFKANWTEFYFALPISLAIIVCFIFLQKFGFVNLINSNQISYALALGIGIVASFSSCLAVVGGLILSLSAISAKFGATKKPQTVFHISRLISFFILGGLLGLLGSAFTVNAGMNFVLTIIVVLVMFILGVNLLEIFPWFQKLQLGLPKIFSSAAFKAEKFQNWLAPFLIGALTFFLPCGFTQSMQIYSLTTGNFFSGALIMFFFALGTLPVLAVISFSSLSLAKIEKSGIFFKTAGLLIIIFALFNLLNSLAGIGFIEPIFNF